MAILPIIIAPDRRLKVISEPVARVDDKIRRLMDDILETMYAAPGIGLAAIQVGVAKQIIVIDLANGKDQERDPHYFVNPRTLWVSEETAPQREGCLSVPEFYDEIDRPVKVVVEYLDYNGTKQERELDGTLSTCLQHEMDHLKGILFIDHLSRLKRSIILKKLSKAQKLKQTA